MTDTAESFSGPVAELLTELRGVIDSLDPAAYSTGQGPMFGGASIGSHVRHTLDHPRALLDSLGSGEVNYDRRERGTPVETDPLAARAEIDSLVSALSAIAQLPADQPLRVVTKPTRDGAPATVRSTLGRELAFVLSHTVHHHATIRSMVVRLGVEPPAGFGYAPSTLAYIARGQ